MYIYLQRWNHKTLTIFNDVIVNKEVGPFHYHKSKLKAEKSGHVVKTVSMVEPILDPKVEVL